MKKKNKSNGRRYLRREMLALPVRFTWTGLRQEIWTEDDNFVDGV
jgi:hypothetical protein